MTQDLSAGRTVLITGCDTGLGREFAKQYANEGWYVIACYKEASNPIQNSPVAEHHQVDVTNVDDIESLAASLASRPLHLLVSNAGMPPDQTVFGQHNYDEMRVMFDVNALGALRLVESLFPNLKKAEGARVILVSSRLGSVGANISGGHIAYRASKAALNAIGRTLAIELFAQKITVTLMHPGWVRSASSGPKAPHSPETAVARMRAQISSLGSHQTGELYGPSGERIDW